ncbi:MAG TPA: PBP1A family penicillin-binding protein [Vitreimonas sp.]|uniref:penicillin-binding protein 1A n=1 Tax=Vitreimonas sp. TaxID=3069702 RepID=UPI002D255EFE|nr:PBP1A family penicillin-binding protein [Vitreimonas sp.]HYD88400.1 PBP1A family penicillin-binding protein [Vitreimonas sp.]
MLRNNSYRAEDRWDDDDYDYDDRGAYRGGDGGGFRFSLGGGPLWRKILVGIAMLAGVGVLLVVGFIIAALQGLPSVADLQDYQPPVSSRVHAGDGALVAEFAEEQRVFVPIEQIPDHVRNAFVAVEDARFFEHSGIDYQGLARAVLRAPLDAMQGRRLQGASTITQQVAGNMLTGRAAECSGGLGGAVCAVWTKLREGLVAQRIERAFAAQGEDGKERILELYLNEIYLGNRAYGVAAAALNYFDKPLSELTVSEAAYLAILPKGPANYQLPRHRERAIDRRNYAVSRMLERGYITEAQAEEARAADLVTRNRLSGDQFVAASHFVEEIRRQVEDQYGSDALLRGGLSIRSTLDTRLQLAAARALRQGLEEYDRRHAWRGPLGAGDPAGDVQAQLREADAPPTLSNWVRAMVTRQSGGVTTLTDENGQTGRLNSDDAQWAAQAARRNRELGLRRGAIVYAVRGSNGGYRLKQIPEIQGALVAMDPHTGRVLAMVGGYSLEQSTGLNRATQAMRQPGSSFKPIVYASALDYGLTPATLIDDGPLAIEAGDGTNWSPENYTREFYGPTTMRRGLELSRNAMTARIAYEMGAERVLDYGRRLGVYDERTQPVFSLALGAGETTLMRMTTAYGMFVNGGRWIQPIMIDRIQDRTGRSVFRRDQRECANCTAEWRSGMRPPTLPDTRQQVIDPVTAYQIVSMAEGVVLRGTATSVNALGFPLGGKTGTTNDYKDAWFIGFSPDLVVGVWAGFDQPRNMGEGETGGRIAAPIFRDFMRVALEDQQPTPFRIPSGVRLVRIDAMTGGLPTATTTTTLLEAFRPDTEPTAGVSSSPFIFGGTDPIDPRVLSGLGDALPSGEQRPQQQQQQPQQQQQQQQQSEDLGGLY